MKILFIRHGESTDDLTDQLGGWGDFDLTPNGKLQIEGTAEKISNLNEDFGKIISSPLLRAKQTAQIISECLNIAVEENIYLKEKNGYGLISGMNKDEVKSKYPELHAKLDTKTQPYIFGSEPQDKFEERVIIGLENILTKDKNLIAVSHGGFLRTLFEKIFKLDIKKIGDGGFVLAEIKTLTEFEILTIDNIELG